MLQSQLPNFVSQFVVCTRNCHWQSTRIINRECFQVWSLALCVQYYVSSHTYHQTAW